MPHRAHPPISASRRPPAAPPNAVARGWPAAVALAVALVGLSASLAVVRPITARSSISATAANAALIANSDGTFGKATVSAAAPPTMTVFVGTPHAYVPLRCGDAETITAELMNPAGLKARAEIDCFYGYHLYLHFTLDPTGRPFDPSAAASPIIAAGDVLVVRSIDTTITAPVPMLSGDVSADGNRAFGRLAPGVTTSLSVFRNTFTGIDTLWPYAEWDGRWSDRFRSASERIPIAADADGAWSVDVSAEASAIRPGDSAFVEQRDTAGHRFIVGIAPPAVVVGRVLGRPIVAVQATNGTRLAVEVAVPGEAPVRFTRRSDVWGWSPTSWDGPGDTILPGFAPSMGGAAFERMPAGTEVSFTRLAPDSDEPVAPTQRMTASAVDLAFGPATFSDGARGRAAPGRAIDVRVAGPLDLQHATSTAADAMGVFTATLPAPLDPGWRALVVEHDGPIAVAHFLTRRHVRVAVGSPFVMGLTDVAYSGGITITLRAGDGRTLGNAIEYGYADGSWIGVLKAARLANGDRGEPVVAAPGTVVEVAFDAGDPVVLPVRELTAAVSAAGDGLHGTAPPGATVLLSGTDGHAATLGWEATFTGNDGLAIRMGAVVVAGLDGRWHVDAAGLGLDRPLSVGDFGSATVVLPSGNALTTGWAPIRIDYDLDSGEVEGSGPPWSRPDVSMLDAAGDRVGRRSDRTAEPGHWDGGWSTDANWQASLGDEQRAAVQPIDGDQLRVDFRTDAAQVPIPPLSGVVHAADGLVVGRSRAGARVVCTRADDRWRVGPAMSATVDPIGIWVLDTRVGAGTAISATRGAACAVEVPPHRFKRAIAAPGLTLDLDRGRVEGRVSAGVAVTVSRAHAGRVLTVAGRADPEGSFSARVPGGAAEPPDAPASPLVPGDVVTVTVPDPRGGTLGQSIVVPPLHVTPDAATNRIAVTTLPEAALHLSLGSAEHHTSWSQNGPLVVPSDGRVDFDATPLGRLSAGTSVVAALWLPSGHRVIRRRFVPRFEVPIGGHRVCAVGTAGEVVSAKLWRGGGIVAAGAGRIAAAGGAAVELRDYEGRPVVTHSGDEVHVVHGDAASAVVERLTVPPLRWSMDWAGQAVEGTTLPNAVVAVEFSSRVDCQPVPFDDWLPHGDQSATADASGQFQWRHEGEMTAGMWLIEDTELNLTLPLPGGHTAIARGRALRADAHVDTPLLAGEVDAGAVVTAVVTDAAGRPRGTGEARADAGGRWRMEIDSGAGTPSLRPGDRVTLVSENQSTLLTVQAFGFDVGRGGDIAGTAPPDATVAAVVDLDPALGWRQPSRTLAITAGASGAWAIPAPAGRRGWSLAEAVALTASVAAEGRHRTVAVWRRPVDLDGVVVRLALPWLGRLR